MSGQYDPSTQPSFNPYPPPSPAPRHGRGLGTAGLVLGIVAVVLAVVPGVLYVGIIAGIIAVVFGAVSLRRRVRAGLPATILGGLGVVIALVFAGLYGIASLDDTPKTAAQAGSESPSAEGSPSEAAASPTTEDEAPETTPGSVASNPASAGTKFEMTNTNRIDGSTADYTEWVDSYNDNFVSTNDYEQPDANMKYVVVTVHATASTAGVDAGTLPYDLALSDAAGAVYDSEFLSGVEDMPSVTLGEGQSASGQVVFQVPNEFHGGVLSFGDGSVFVKTN
jgi:hypothetical protein